MEKMTDEAIMESLQSLPEWSRQDEKWMVRKFRFASFKDAMTFANRVAIVAEAMNHHPMIAIDFKMVTIRLTSWKAQGISQLDVDQAGQLDRIYEQEQDRTAEQ